MQQSNRELWLSFIAILAITLIYLFVAVTLGGVPAASELFGHGIGIIGFILMLMTETLYTLRKRSRSARWGRMSSWLQFHIFTGLVGPYMVLLHSSWKFNGLAGMLMLLTLIMVASGFMGRYIYTSVPRNADGIELEAADLDRQIVRADGELKNWLAAQPDQFQQLSQRLSVTSASTGSRLIFGRVLDDWTARMNWWQVSRQLDQEGRLRAKQLDELLQRGRILRRELASLALTRRMLGLWHTIHIPIGMVLFTAAFIHIVAAIYYASLLH